MKKLNYYLWVFLLVSCQEILLEEDIRESTFNLFGPSTNSTVRTSKVHFTWGAIEGASHYQIQIATPDFLAPIKMINEMVDESEKSFELTEGNYEWRVKALNSAYETPYSAAIKFEVILRDDFSELTSAIISPKKIFIPPHKARQSSVTITREGDGLHELVISETGLQVDFPEGGTLWRMRAEIKPQNTFSSGRSEIVDPTAYYLLILISPTDEDEHLNPENLFNWQMEAVEASGDVCGFLLVGNQEQMGFLGKAKVVTPHHTTLIQDSIYYSYLRNYEEGETRAHVGSREGFLLV